MGIRLREFYEIGTSVNEDPQVWVFEDFLSGSEIDALLRPARERLQQALVSSAQAGVESEGRSGSNCWVAHKHDAVLAALSQRIADIVNLPLVHAESFQVVHYDRSEEYAPHYDAWDAGTERGQRCMARGGQRLVTCLAYLNDPEQGGNTIFPRLDLQVRAKKGRMLLFHNCYPDSVVRHPHSLHGGMPVLRGEKWACNLWFREQPYQSTGSAKVPTATPDETPGSKTRII